MRAVGASMTASSIRIDRLLERNIRRVVGRDDRARALRLQCGRDAVGRLLHVPPVVDRFELRQVEATRRIGEGSPALQYLFSGDGAAHEAYCTPIQTVQVNRCYKP